MSRGAALWRDAGLSYAEVLVATLLIAVSLVPALEALHGATLGGVVHESVALQRRKLATVLEGVLARAFTELEAAEAAAAGAPTSYSDPPGSPDRSLVYLSRYDGDDADSDGDPFTGTDDDLLWVRVEIEATPHALESLTAR